MNDKEWLQHLKVGDEVLIPARYGSTYSVGKVTRVTATQFAVLAAGHETRHNKDTGWQRGGGYNSRVIVQVTPERLEEAKVYALRVKAKRLMEKMTIPQDRAGVEALLAALSPFVEVPDA